MINVVQATIIKRLSEDSRRNRINADQFPRKFKRNRQFHGDHATLARQVGGFKGQAISAATDAISTKAPHSQATESIVAMPAAA